MRKFAHLHLHTDASLLDGLGTVDRMINHAASMGFESLAHTDHGTMANVVAFSLACQANNIKAIHGLEGYIDINKKVGHITLLARNLYGLEDLIKLNNQAHKSSTGRRPSFTLEQLQPFARKLICLTGCVSSPLQWLPEKEAQQYVGNLKQIFGDRLYAEVMLVSDTDTWSKPLALAKQFKLVPVITNDVHFPFAADADVHNVLTMLKAKMTYESRHLYLKGPNQILARASHLGLVPSVVTKWMDNASDLAGDIERINLACDPSLPPISAKESSLFALKISKANMRMFGGTKDETKAVKRLRSELDVITRMGYMSYFYILDDIVSHAKRVGAKVGPGRGSGTGSLVLFVLGVTEINPIEHDLSFERFLNVERKGYPDVDVDFDSVSRPEILEYAKKRWNGLPVATYARYSHKTLTHDLAKHFRLPRNLEVIAAEKGPESPEFAKLTAGNPLFVKTYGALQGQIKNAGRHAGGIVVTERIVPIEKIGGEFVVAWTQGEHDELTYSGIVKFDLLGLSVLSALKELEARTGEHAPAPSNDTKVFKLFQDGDLAGIFQFGSSQGILDLTKSLQPTTFNDIIALNALYRPGALDAKTAFAYPDYKKSPRKIHPKIDIILKDTYGVIVYQEDVMAIFAAVTGGNLAKADLARRVIVKSHVGDPKWEAEVFALKEKFMKEGTDNGYDNVTLKHLWTEIITHARYSFNRSHATGYARIAWDTAWYKTYYPKEFFCVMMKWDSDNTQAYLFDCAQRGIKIVPPRINMSTESFETDGTSIFLPLGSVKYLGDTGVQEILAERKSGKFKSMSDFANRISARRCNSRARLGLYAVGAFDGVAGNPVEANIDTTQIDESVDLLQEYIGIVIPTVAMTKTIAAETKLGRICGVVVGSEKKSSRYGPYTVYRLSPSGVFWTRDLPRQFRSGDLVSARVNGNSGRAKEVQKL